MDPKFKEFYEKNVIPIGNRIIIKYCKIDCLGNKLTYDSVQAALEFTRAGRAGYSTIKYDISMNSILIIFVISLKAKS